MLRRFAAYNLFIARLAAVITFVCISSSVQGQTSEQKNSAQKPTTTRHELQEENIPLPEGALNNPKPNNHPRDAETPKVVQGQIQALEPGSPDPRPTEQQQIKLAATTDKSLKWLGNSSFINSRLSFSFNAKIDAQGTRESITFARPEGYGFKILTKEDKLWPWLLIPKSDPLPLKPSHLPNASALISGYLPVTFIDLLRYVPDLKSLGIFTLDYIAPQAELFYSINTCVTISSRPSASPKTRLLSKELDVEKKEEFEIATDTLSRYYFNNDLLVMKEVLSGDRFRRIVYFYLNLREKIKNTPYAKHITYNRRPDISNFLVAIRIQSGTMKDLDPKITHDLLFLIDKGEFCFEK